MGEDRSPVWGRGGSAGQPALRPRPTACSRVGYTGSHRATVEVGAHIRRCQDSVHRLISETGHETASPGKARLSRTRAQAWPSSTHGHAGRSSGHPEVPRPPGPHSRMIHNRSPLVAVFLSVTSTDIQGTRVPGPIVVRRGAGHSVASTVRRHNGILCMGLECRNSLVCMSVSSGG